MGVPVLGGDSKGNDCAVALMSREEVIDATVHYYVYDVDWDFGPFFLKFCSHLPYNCA